jgi:hypothetical protein
MRCAVIDGLLPQSRAAPHEASIGLGDAAHHLTAVNHHALTTA